jgi:hypothetical protein
MKTFEDFKREFPSLYDHPKLFDFSLPPGWTELVWELSQSLVPLGIEVVQVKSKFGGLRFYTDTLVDPDAAQLISEAESKSFHICEECGAPGETQGVPRGLVTTRCGKHPPT